MELYAEIPCKLAPILWTWILDRKLKIKIEYGITKYFWTRRELNENGTKN